MKKFILIFTLSKIHKRVPLAGQAISWSFVIICSVYIASLWRISEFALNRLVYIQLEKCRTIFLTGNDLELPDWEGQHSAGYEEVRH